MTGAPQPSEYERVKIFSLVKDEDGSISRVPMCLCELCRVNHFLCPRYAADSSATTSAEVLDERTVKIVCKYLQGWAKWYLKDHYNSAPPFTEWIGIIGALKRNPKRVEETPEGKKL